MKRWLGWLWLLLCGLGAASAQPPGSAVLPGLPEQARELAEGVWLFEGRREHFTRSNGGNIVNTGFIVTEAGVVVFDPGPSLRYGQAQRAAIRKATGREVVRVYVSHAHPDHFLGSGAYTDVPVVALPATVEAIRQHGEALTANLYRLVGGAMSGTSALPPQALELGDGIVQIGDRRLRLLALQGHTTADLALLDERGGVLFAGDLVFFERAPTTPDADIAVWLESLEQLAGVSYRVLVPGHGPAVLEGEAVAQTREYLKWLQQALEAAAGQGLDMNEVMRQPLPDRFKRLAVLQDEWRRSISHLYPEIEAQALPVR